MAAKLEIEFDTGEMYVWKGWHAQLMWPLVRLIVWMRGGKLIRRKKP